MARLRDSKLRRFAGAVGCMAEVLKRAGRPVSEYSSLGFFVIAPEERINKGIFRQQMDPQHIYDGIAQRISMYPAGELQDKRQQWLAEWAGSYPNRQNAA